MTGQDMAVLVAVCGVLVVLLLANSCAVRLWRQGGPRPRVTGPWRHDWYVVADGRVRRRKTGLSRATKCMRCGFEIDKEVPVVPAAAPTPQLRGGPSPRR